MAELPSEEELERLLADPAHRHNPLLPLVAALAERNREQRIRLERLLRISDSSYCVAISRNQDLLQQYDRQLKRLDKITRISDRYQRSLLELNDQLRQAALRDPLTGLANRRQLMERLHDEQARCRRGQPAFALAMLDVDHFKRINDTYGHDTGDRVLCRLAETLAGQLRTQDLCARWGGEEFVLLLPHTALEPAGALLRRIMTAVRELVVDEVPALRLTVSAGLTTHQPHETLDDTLRRADQLLIGAKNAGRDRLHLAGA
ncbi:biofilm regulation diguanylate cyclase SiaD [Oceanimonas pelagia]|uniref:diguanylate cyclase n=1 Tax=Oceanimonas pelagia TaxID=3028314 RepID=A0AA50Q985_9GAMM|nr:biofilm regulation diguanylate cyclase SiaD [Oceanimonas pelagia]WMC09788.1 biofilm regulation diguanylate cyclase SiaD [Oceanimonas pelagia]